MSHSHEHSHGHPAYRMEQLCTIGACGLLGLVAVMLYYQKSLNFILAHFLHSYVLWSGFLLLGLAAIRALFVWSPVNRCCDHDHGHGWSPWRYIVLSIPIMLFFLGLPNQSFSSAKAVEVEDSDRIIMDQAGDLIYLDFRDLEHWAFDESKREWSEGRTGLIKGQFAPGRSPHLFNVVRYKMMSCPCDAIRLSVAVISPEGVADIKSGAWVQVTGQIQYRKRKDRAEIMPVLKLRSRDDVLLVPPDNDPFLQ
jgi:hypothetical protein